MTDKMTFTPFSQIIGQERAIKFLEQVMAGDKIPHAYPFVGIPGIGKTKDNSHKKVVYHPREPEGSPLWRLLNNHYDNFEQCYEER